MSSKPELNAEVVAWAREEAQRAVDKLRAFQKLAEDQGDTDRARGLLTAARTVEWMLIGGTGCVIAAFDERRPMLEPMLRQVTPEMQARQDAARERIRERNRRIFGTEGEERIHSAEDPAKLEAVMRVCPECKAGKHGNCDGTALDVFSDAIADCLCKHGAEQPVGGRDE